MIRRRLTDKVKIVSINDPALTAILSPTEQVKYRHTRDFSIIEKHAPYPEQPTIFHVEPLRIEHESLVGNPMFIFQAYVSRVDGVDPEMCRTTEKEGFLFLHDDAARLYPREVILEIADVIVQLASRDGISRPFSVLDTWQALTTEKSTLAAIAALEKTV